MSTCTQWFAACARANHNPSSPLFRWYLLTGLILSLVRHVFPLPSLVPPRSLFPFYLFSYEPCHNDNNTTMAWPNNFNTFWEAMYGPQNRHPPRGAGVDHDAPPPPPELRPLMSPDFWNRWASGPPGEGGPWAHHGPPHAHHHHHHARGWGAGGPGGRRHHWAGEDGSVNNNNNDNNQDHPESGSGSENDGEHLPEYISDDEAAYAAAAAEVDAKKHASVPASSKDKNKDNNSPATMMQEDDDVAAAAADPPEEVPDGDEDFYTQYRQRRHPRHGNHLGGPGGFGPHRRHSDRRRGGHRGPPPPPPPFPRIFDDVFGGGAGGPPRHPHPPHGPPRAGGAHHPPPPFFPPMFDFLGALPPRPSSRVYPRRHRHGHPRGPPPSPPPAPHQNAGDETSQQGPFDLRSMMGALANHPYAHHLRTFLERAQQQQNPPNNNNRAAHQQGTPYSDDDDDDMATITPPLDLYDQPGQWVLHLAMPGAHKQDTAVHWDADRSVLAVSGVVYRPGDEDFQATLVTGERRVGLLAREVRLPPPHHNTSGGVGESSEASKEDVDPEGIVAKMEDGILVVTVPKVEKDWTDVKKVEIE